MPRRREIAKREVLPDPKYISQDVAKFINVVMTRGKKSVAERMVYGAFEQIAKKAGRVSRLRNWPVRPALLTSPVWPLYLHRRYEECR